MASERATGIEPAWPAWKAGALPLSYARVIALDAYQTLWVRYDEHRLVTF